MQMSSYRGVQQSVFGAQPERWSVLRDESDGETVYLLEPKVNDNRKLKVDKLCVEPPFHSETEPLFLNA